MAKKALLGAVLIAHQATALAAFECNVRVQNVLVYAGGEVNVLHTGREDFTVVCNLNGQYGPASQFVCASWLGILSQAQRSGGLVQFYFGGEGSCRTMGTYGNAPVPIYIGHVK